DGNDFVDVAVLELGPQVTVNPLFELLHGPPPLAATFTAHGQPGIMLISASGFRPGAQGESAMLGVTALLDGQAAGGMGAFTNEPLSHKALVPGYLVLAPTAG